MEQNMENIDDFFKEELGSYAELPPPPAWGALEKRLDEGKKRRLFPYRWYWFISLVALMAITGLSVAWKMSANRESLAGGVPTFETKSQAAASTPGNTTTSAQNRPQTERASSAEATHTTSLAKTTRHTSTTKKRKHTVPTLTLAATNGSKISKQKEDILNQTNTEDEHRTITSAAKSTSRQYDEDYYEGATASIAPTPAELSAPAGYSVNKRRRNNMLIADMTPKEEPATRYAATTPEATTYSGAVAETPSEESAVQILRKPARIVRHAAQKKAAHNTVAAVHKKTIRSNGKRLAIAAATTPKSAAPTVIQPNHSNTTAVAKVQKPVVLASTPVAAATAKTTAVHTAPKQTSKTNISTSQPVLVKVATEKKTTEVAAPIAKNNTHSAKTVSASHHTKTKTSTATIKQEIVTSATSTGSVAAKAKNQPELAKTISASTTGAPASISDKTPAKPELKTAAAKTSKQVIAEPAATSAAVLRTKQHEDAKPVKKSNATAKAATTLASTAGKAKTYEKSGTATSAQVPAHEKTSRTTTGKIAIAPLPASEQSKSVAVNATAPKARAGRKTKMTATSKDDAVTAVAAITGTKPSGKPAKTSAKSPLTASTMLAHTSNPAPVKGVSSPFAKQERPKAGKPAASTFAASARTAKTPATSKTSSPARVFGGNLSRFNEEEPPAEDPTINTTASALAATRKEETLPGTFKDKATTNEPLTTVRNDEVKPMVDSATTAAKHRRFEAGIKAGFEGSYNGSAARKMVISPYFDYKLSNRFSLLIQPSIKAANAQKKDLSGNQTFYSINHTDSTLTSTAATVIFDPRGVVDTIAIIRTYSYSQTHQEIKKSYNVGGTYFEFELPLLLKYAITPKLAMYAGLNINYSRALRISENTINGTTVKLDSMFGVPTMGGQPVSTPPSVSSVFQYPGQPISSYAGPLYPTPTGGIFRLGYMLGFSYEFKKRWLADALIQQGFAKSNVVGGVDVNKPLALPYVRLTLGYKLTK